MCRMPLCKSNKRKPSEPGFAWVLLPLTGECPMDHFDWLRQMNMPFWWALVDSHLSSPFDAYSQDWDGMWVAGGEL